MESQVHSEPQRAERATKRWAEARAVPVLGLLPNLLLDAIGTISELARAHDRQIVSMPLGPAKMLLLTQPEHYQHVFQDHWRNYPKGGAMWKPLRVLFGNGLVTSDGDLWVRSRHLLQPLFSHKSLAGVVPLMSRAVGVTLDEMERNGKVGRRVDFAAEMPLITQRVLMTSVFGGGIDLGEADTLADSIMEAFRQLNYRLFLFFLPGWLPLPGEGALRRSIRSIDEAMFRRLRERRARPTGGRDILSLLLAASGGDSLDDRQIRDEAVTLFVAGNETTALVMCWLFWLLDAHPDVDRRVRAEVAEVVGERPPEYEDLAKLTYLKTVIQETMRLYPPAWILPRTTLHDDVIDGYPVPAGTPILTCPWVTHRDPKLWDRPDDFDPDRFSEARLSTQRRFSYVPFGAGPRTCIGNAFAMMESQIIATMLIQRFRPRLAPGHQVVPQASTTLRPRGGMPMILGAAS